MIKRLIKWSTIFAVIISLIIGGLLVSPYGEFVSWQFDLIRGFKHTFPTERVRDHEVTLVQTAGIDFYETYFLVIAPDGKTIVHLVDGDDHRWKDPRTKIIGSRLYYIEGSGQITDQTSYIDKEQGIVYAGYLRRTLRLPVSSASTPLKAEPVRPANPPKADG